MIRRFLALLIATLAIPVLAQEGLAQDAPAKDAPAKDASPPATTRKVSPMRFEWVREGPADACKDKCREWVSAVGDITPDTPRDFVALAQTRDLRGATIVLDSSGGAVIPALALGRIFRRLGVSTTVGKTIKVAGAGAGDERAMLTPRGTCASMCVFVLLGGARRHVPSEGRVYVHQIWPSTKREDAFAGTYSAGDLVRTQRELGLMAQYTVDMGAEIALFETAMRIPPWENARPLSADEITRMRLQNAENPFMAPLAGIVTDPRALTAVAAGQTVIVGDRGWVVTETAGGRSITRKLPITVEGEQIGSFELSFSCAEPPGRYAAVYTETRRLTDAVKDRLSAIMVAAGKERVLLKVESSGQEGAANEVRTVARGPVSPALVESLAEANGPALTLATLTTAKSRTAIRIGNSGFGEGFSQVMASCPK
jgi:hypothetical protein